MSWSGSDNSVIKTLDIFSQLVSSKFKGQAQQYSLSSIPTNTKCLFIYVGVIFNQGTCDMECCTLFSTALCSCRLSAWVLTYSDHSHWEDFSGHLFGRPVNSRFAGYS